MGYFRDLSIQIFGAAVGAGLAVWGSFQLYEISFQKSEEIKLEEERLKDCRIIKSLVEEVEDNIYQLQSVISAHAAYRSADCDPITRDDGECLVHFRKFSNVAWNAAISSGVLHLVESYTEISDVRQHYNHVSRINYISDKVMHGKYQEFEGENYEKQIAEALAELSSFEITVDPNDSSLSCLAE